MSEIKKKLEALLALQDEYIQLVEEENPDCSEPLSYYTELLEELKISVKKNSMKYARTIIQNEYFQHCLAAPNGTNIYLYFFSLFNRIDLCYFFRCSVTLLANFGFCSNDV